MNATAPLPPASGTVPNHLAWSVIVTVLAFFVCCLSCFSLPGIATGIVAIVYSSKVNTLLNRGDLEGARGASRSAKLWAWITTGFLILGVVALVWALGTVGVEGTMDQLRQLQQQMEQMR